MDGFIDGWMNEWIVNNSGSSLCYAIVYIVGINNVGLVFCTRPLTAVKGQRKYLMKNISTSYTRKHCIKNCCSFMRNEWDELRSTMGTI